MAYHEIDGALFKDAPANDGKKHPLMRLELEVALALGLDVIQEGAET